MAAKRIAMYALCEPDSGDVRYIGQAIDPDRRLEQHMGSLRADSSPKASWLRALRACGKRPTLRILEMTAAEEAQAAERRQIAEHVAAGCTLTNVIYNVSEVIAAGSIADEVWIAVRVPRESKARLEGWAQRRDTSMSWIVRRLIAEALESKRDERDGL